jgi:hypothetical protein
MLLLLLKVMMKTMMNVKLKGPLNLKNVNVRKHAKKNVE